MTSTIDQKKYYAVRAKLSSRFFCDDDTETLSTILTNIDDLISISIEEASQETPQTVTWLLNQTPDLTALTKNLNNIIALGLWDGLTQSPELFCEEIEDKNWLDHVYEPIKPFTIGSFHIYDMHENLQIPQGQYGLKINAARAFGSGSHGTTHGCLDLIEELKNNGFTPKTFLDIGTGSAILSIAATKIWPNTKGVATDICQDSINTAKDYLKINDCDNNIDLIHADGFENNAIKGRAPYDLVIANILPVVLKPMASDIQSVTKQANGYLILSGIIKEQEQGVLDTYTANGFNHIKTIQIDEWCSILLKTS